MYSTDPLLNEYLFEIINQAQYGITICDPNKEDNPLIFVNETFCKIFGYTKEEVLGKNCRFLQNNEREQINLEKIRKAIKDKTSTTTVLRNYTKNGKLIYNEIKISPIFDKDGTLKYYLGIQKDISDLMAFNNFKNISHIFEEKHIKDTYTLDEIKIILNELSIYQAELLAQNDELLEKEQTLSSLHQEFLSLFKDAPVPFLLVDKNLQILKYNDESDKIFCFSKSKLLVKSMFQFVDKSSISNLVSWITNKHYLKGNLDLAMICENSKLNMFKIKAKPYALDNNLLIVSLVDIQMDYIIKQEMRELIEVQNQLAIEKDEIIQKNSRLVSMGEMIDAIAHQWKQPLGIISLRTIFLHQLSEDKQTVDLKDVLECKDAVMSQINHLVSTLEHFRDFLRPNNILEEFDLQETISSTLILVKDEMMQYNIEISTNFKDEIKISGIKNEFKHVILNILSNAKDIFIEREIENKKILIETFLKNGKVFINIKDNAGGIPEDIIENIFENHISGKKSGTGIGLYMSKKIVEKMGGIIKANNETFDDSKNLGAIFSIIL